MENSVTFYRWEDSMSVGSEELDYQHRHMIAIINEVYRAYVSNARREDIAAIIDKLAQYMVYHFSMEEVYFEMFNFYDRDNHVKEHMVFREKVEEFINKYKSDDANLTCEVMNFLKDWFSDHVLVSDMKYVDCFARNFVK